MNMADYVQKQLVLIGAGGHAAVVEAAIGGCGKWETAAILDDGIAAGTKLVYGTVSGTCEMLPGLLQRGIDCVHVAIGNNETRTAVTGKVQTLGFQPVVLQHPSAIVEPEAAIGSGSFLSAGSIVGTRTTIGNGCIINTGATVDHDCKIGDFTHICPGVHLAGEVRVGAGTMIGIGASVIQQVTIGENCIIGAGAIVIRDVPSGMTMVGNPAAVIGNR